jgi:hypothetical protein
VLGGTFGVTAGKLQLTSPATSLAVPNSNMATHLFELPTNHYEFFVDGNAPASSSSFDDFTVFFNVTDEFNHHFVNISEGNDAASNGLFRVSGGVATQIVGFGSNTTPPGTARRIRVQNIAGTIRVFRDDIALGTPITESQTGTKVGVGSRNNAATFDNVFVERR